MIRAAILCALAGAVLASPLTAQPVADPQPAHAAPATPRDLSAELEAIRAEHGTPALAALIMRDGVIIAHGAAGLRAADSTEPVTTSDLWHIGSCTKAMTATMIARLVDSGALPKGWDTTVADALAQTLGDQLHADWKSVTIAELLVNRGGAAREMIPAGMRMMFLHDGPSRIARLDYLRLMLAQPPAVPAPATGPRAFEYSNAGFMLAAAMAEAITDADWETLMRREVFAPLGMTTAGFGPPGSATTLDQPRGHRPEGNPIKPGRAADNPPGLGPAGTVHLSLADWASFCREHVLGAQGKSTFLKPETWARLHTPAPAAEGESQTYAMGWVVTARQWGGQGILTHAGSNTMWFAQTWTAPERGIVVLGASNIVAGKGEKAVDQAIGAMIRSLRDQP